MVQERRQMPADQGDKAVAGVLTQLLGRQPSKGRLRIEARDSQQNPDHDLAEAKNGLVGHDRHPERPSEPGPVGVWACQVHRFGSPL